MPDLRSVPPLREPVLVAAFEGWNDAGEAASDCIAIEDSETGARSAAGAGARTIVVPSVKAVPRMPGVVQIPTLVGVTPTDLVDLPGFAALPSRG